MGYLNFFFIFVEIYDLSTLYKICFYNILNNSFHVFCCVEKLHGFWWKHGRRSQHQSFSPSSSSSWSVSGSWVTQVKPEPDQNRPPLWWRPLGHFEGIFFPPAIWIISSCILIESIFDVLFASHFLLRNIKAHSLMLEIMQTKKNFCCEGRPGLSTSLGFKWVLPGAGETWAGGHLNLSN